MLNFSNLLAKCEQVKTIHFLQADNSAEIDVLRGVADIKAKNDKFQYYTDFGDAYHFFTALTKSIKDNGISLIGHIFLIDSIRNFILGDFIKDNEITRFFSTLQILRDVGATIIFLHHEPKSSDTFKGATAFFDSCDLVFSLKNYTDVYRDKLNTNEFLTILEPTKKRADAKPHAFILDNKTNDIKIVDFAKFGLSFKEKIVFDYILKALEKSPGVCQKELVNQVKDLIGKDYPKYKTDEDINFSLKFIRALISKQTDNNIIKKVKKSERNTFLYYIV